MIEDFNCYEDFENFLKLHQEIKTFKDLKQNYLDVYKRFFELRDRFKKIPKDKTPPLNIHRFGKRVNYDSIKTKENFQNFINKNKIENCLDFSRRFSSLYNKYKISSFKDELIFIGKTRPKLDSKFNDINEVQNYIDNNKIYSSTDIRKNFPSLYNYIKRNGWISKLDFPIQKTRLIDFNKYSSLEDIQNYVDKNNILDNRDFKDNHYKIYRRAQRIGVLNSINYINGRTRKLQDTTKYTSISQIQKIIDNEGIRNKYEFIKLHKHAYSQYGELRIKDKTDLVFPDNSIQLSLYEERFLLWLEDHHIKYQLQYWFPDFIKNTKPYRFDFYLPDMGNLDNNGNPLGIFIEINGEQHFWTDEEVHKQFSNVDPQGIQYHDKKKKEYVESKGMDLYYLSYNKRLVEERGYFDKVYFSEEDLFNYLKTIYTNVPNF